RNNKEFIKTLFPSGEIYASLLPVDAQEVIGQVGRNSKGAAHLLSKIGFRYSHRVDPFDGGPHFEAELTEISLLKKAALGRIMADEQFSPVVMGICGRILPNRASGDRFKAVFSPYDLIKDQKSIKVPKSVADALGIGQNEYIAAIRC